MKFIYFQDFHYQGKNSRNRLGNYSEDLLLKLDEIIAIAKENKCEAILDGGDLLEGDKPSYSVLDDIADKIEKVQIPMYSLFGNHALSYGHIENSNNTGLMHLQKRSKYFNSFEFFNNHNEEMRAEGYEILPIEYKYEIEEEIKEKGIQFIDENQWKICIVHALITPSKFFDNVCHIQCKDVKTNADLILVAHYHKPYKKEINGTTFLNIGCSGRLNIDEAKIEPSVLLLDTDKRSYEVIKLKSAKKAEDIFDLEKYSELKENEKSIEEFISLLNSSSWQSCDVRNQIKLIGKENNVDKEVINYLLEKIGEQV